MVTYFVVSFYSIISSYLSSFLCKKGLFRPKANNQFLIDCNFNLFMGIVGLNRSIKFKKVDFLKFVK